MSGIFFNAVVQAVIFFGVETWLMNPHMGRALVGIQHRLARWITGRHPQRVLDGSWEYPPLDAGMDTVIKEAGFEDMEACVLKI